MNATELFLRDGNSAGIYFCATCRCVCQSKEIAEQCCDYKCKVCGAPSKQFWTICDSCRSQQEDERELKLFEQSEKVNNYSGPVMIPGSDTFFESIEDMLDTLEPDDVPEHVWCCSVDPVCVLNYDSIIENATQEAYDDFDPADLNGKDELVKALKAFNAENASHHVWTPDYTRSVIVTKPSEEP